MSSSYIARVIDARIQAVNNARDMRGFAGRVRRAFTLVELLVVIGIIALLISILLPSLASARRSAQTVACGANLHSIVQAMQIYATQYSGWIPGSPWTTGYELIPNGEHTIPAYNDQSEIITAADWECPLAKVMGIPFEEGSNNQVPNAWTTRFLQMQNLKTYICPSNSVVVSEYTGGSPPGLPSILMPSYNTALIFLFEHYDAAAQAAHPGWATSGEGTFVDFITVYNLPEGYVPKLNKVGNLSRKIYIADGARFMRVGTKPGGPDYSPTSEADGGGMMADQGAWSSYTASWDRFYAQSTSKVTGTSIDSRLFAYRHGKQQAFLSADNGLLMNAAFYDGHVESLSDLQSANPVYWMPKGTTIVPASGEVYTDVIKRYFGGLTTAHTIDE